MMKRNFIKILKSQAGVTLVELLVYVGMLGGVSVLIATLGVGINRSNVVREADLLATEFMQDFQSNFSRQGVCDYNFEGENSTSAGAAFKYPNEIRNSDNSVLYSVGQELDNYFTLSSMSIAKVNNSRADITLQFTRRSSNANAVTTLTRKLKLTVVHEVDGVTVNKCLVSFDQNIGDQLPLICNGEGTILSDSGTPTDETDDICIHSGYSMEQCPSTEYVQRFELVNIDDGSGKLQPYYRPVCIAADKPRSLRCAAGEILQGYSAIDGLLCRPIVASDIENYFLGDYGSCALNQQFPIKLVGSNINIHCGSDIATPTATPTATVTPTPTATTSGSTECITVKSLQFSVSVPLTTPLDPAVAGRNVIITVTGQDIGSPVPIIFRAVYQSSTPAGSLSLNMLPGFGPGLGGSSYPKMFLFMNASVAQNYLYIQRVTGFPDSPAILNFHTGLSVTYPVITEFTIAKCGFGEKKSSCLVNYQEPLTGLEAISPLTICIDDSYSSSIPMYNHSDPFVVTPL